MREVRLIFRRGQLVDYQERDASTMNLVLMDQQGYEGIDLDQWR